jgi:hypothetical protein
MLYRAGTMCVLESGAYDWLIVKDQAELDAALAGGWHLDELTLVGGPLLEYGEKAGAVDALVYLRTKDDALAASRAKSDFLAQRVALLDKLNAALDEPPKE